jgi:hypothetical protein
MSSEKEENAVGPTELRSALEMDLKAPVVHVFAQGKELTWAAEYAYTLVHVALRMRPMVAKSAMTEKPYVLSHKLSTLARTMYATAERMLETIEMVGRRECDSKLEVMKGARLPVMDDWKALTA